MPFSKPNPDEFKRLKRYEIRGHARALNFACYQNQPFLRSERACTWVVESAAAALAEHEIALWAYCLMPTHMHMIVLPCSEQPDVAAFLASFKKSVALKAIAWARRNSPSSLARMRVRRPNGAIGHRFWQDGGGFDRNLWSPRATWNMIDYVHRNPVEEGLCERPEDWRWSSAGWWKDKRAGPLEINPIGIPPRPYWHPYYGERGLFDISGYAAA